MSDLSNFYLDIAKDRLYVSAPNDARRRSCQTVMALIIERLAGAIAPVLCHMAEDIWQHLPYAVSERSVFQRGWPKAEPGWNDLSAEAGSAINAVVQLRALVNRQLETCRSQGALGASLEAAVQLEPGEGELAQALQAALAQLEASPHPSVDNLADWLLVSQLQIGGNAPAAPLVQAEADGVTVRISRASGEKCERCWHYTNDIGAHVAHPTICGRCIEALPA